MDQRARPRPFRHPWPALALLAALLVVALAAPLSGAGPAAAPAAGQDEHWTTFQLVYHSDTEGYIDPCG